MKRLLSLLPLAALLFSCGNGPNDPSLSPSFEESPSSIQKDYSDSPWGEEAAKACEEAVFTVIPYVPCASFEFETGVDEFGDGTIHFFLFYETDDEAASAFTDFAYACADRMYRVELREETYFDPDALMVYTFPVGYADALITETLAIEIAFTTSTYKGQPCLGLFCITYLYVPEDVFPAAALDDLYGENHGLPAVEGDGYTYAFSFFIDETSGSEALVIAVYGGDYSLEERYFEALDVQGYDLVAIDPYNETMTDTLSEYPGLEMGMVYRGLLGDKLVYFCYDFDANALVLEFYRC